ncbi:multiple epidermal growth factor-like domains protein 10 [Littorina saxatilis]|uniref:multiple epidermal growth factor-like domains protein 10 n=1 Tax=Littorina saxatilis TaxID=31220 RepID=UPI0038B5719F
MSCDPLARRCLVTYGEACQDNRDKCTTGAACNQTSRGQTCVCQPAYTQHKDFCWPAQGKLGGQCQPGNSCSDANAACTTGLTTTGLCLCNDGYQFKPSDASCERSSSGVHRVAASVMCVVMGFILSKLL